MDYTQLTCPSCQYGMAPILYGYPTAEMVEYARQELIALGGPTAKEYSHYCYSCDELYVMN